MRPPGGGGDFPTWCGGISPPPIQTERGYQEADGRWKERGGGEAQLALAMPRGHAAEGVAILSPRVTGDTKGGVEKTSCRIAGRERDVTAHVPS